MDWYEEDVKMVEQQAYKLAYKPTMIFYGSSSIRLWETLEVDFEAYKPVNLGFGGSTLEACVYFFKRIMQPYQEAKQLLVYAGDNDLGDGKEPEEVLHFFTQLVEVIKKFFKPEIKIFYLSVKPSIARWDINDKIIETNSLIEAAIHHQFPEIGFINIYNAMLDEQGVPSKDLYAEDGLHLSEKGYAVWKKVIGIFFTSAIGNESS